MLWIASSSLTVIAAYLLHNYAERILKEKAATFAPAIAYSFTLFCLRNTYESAHRLLLCTHLALSLVAHLSVRAPHPVLRRALYLPLLTSLLSLLCVPSLPFPPSRLSALAVALLQCWSALRGLLMLAVFPATALSHVAARQRQRQRERGRPAGSGREGGEALRVPSAPGVWLDARVAHPTGLAGDRWIVYIGGNAEEMENSCEEMTCMTEALRAHWVFYNPRGVGRSTGYVTCVQDLVDDAAAVVRFVIREKGVAANRLMLWGHSIGGGIAAAVARQHAEILAEAPLLFDRTFSRLSDAAAQFSPLSKNATRMLLRAAVGELDTAGDCAAVRNKKLIVFHRMDEIILYSVSALARPAAYREACIDSACVVELSGDHVTSPHNSQMSCFHEYQEIQFRVKSLFQ